MPYTHINGSTFPGPDPTLEAAAPPVTDPNYDTDVIAFVDANAPDVWNGIPVNFGTTFGTTVTYADAFPTGDAPLSLVPLLNLQIWGVPLSGCCSRTTSSPSLRVRTCLPTSIWRLGIQSTTVSTIRLNRSASPVRTNSAVRI
jgi:hypothetical protein